MGVCFRYHFHSDQSERVNSAPTFAGVMACIKNAMTCTHLSDANELSEKILAQLVEKWLSYELF